MTTNYQTISTSDEVGDIKCPFIRMVQPNTQNLWTFSGDLSANGTGWLMSFLFSFYISVAQLGWWKALTGHAPDIYRLDQVAGVSHSDLFTKYLNGTTDRVIAARDSDGMITLQDLVRIKKWIVEQEGIEKMEQSSKMETGLVFLGAGGDLETQQVPANDVLDLLNATRPSGEIVVNIERMVKCDMKMVWA
mmetsp:Transcript_23194/g.38393  ORF Transcript_23194/g.38393 Transcript_23194/m.38393 type:complete len:191 (-) Transcript_23194:1357-1929(-)